MVGNYPIARIGEVAASISETHKFGKEELVFLNTSDILHGKFLHHTYSAVKNWPGQAKKSIRKGDILFSEIRPANGRWAYVKHDADDFVVSTKLMVIRAKPDRISPKFLYQFLTSSEITKWLQHLAESRSGTFPQITFDQVATLEVLLPSLAEQGAITTVLGALDDEIELTRRMSATLEAIARALFQSWFVEFDPVRAKVDGRLLAGIDSVTAGLFPDQLEDSPLGHIPKGWKVGTMVEGFNLTMGQSPPGDTYNEDGHGLPLYQGRTDFGFRFPTRRIYCSAPTRYAKPGDTLVSVRAPVGDINMASEQCCIGRGVAAVRHKSGAKSFTYYTLANLYPDFARFEAEGTVFGSINKDSFEKLRFLIPPTEIVAAFEHCTAPLDDQIRTLHDESRTLVNVRNTLLPKLLSGELRMADVENTVSE